MNELPQDYDSFTAPHSWEWQVLAGGLGVHQQARKQPWHDLPCWLISEVVAGALQVETRADGVHVLEPGDVMIIPPRVERRFFAPSRTRFCRPLAACAFFMAGGRSFIAVAIATFTHKEHAATAVIDFLQGNVLQPGRGIGSEPAEQQIHAARFFASLAEYGAENGDAGLGYDHERARLQPVFDRLHTHYHLPTSREGLAQLIGVSATHLADLFRECTGMGPIAYLLDVRLQKSRELGVDVALRC